MVSLWQSKHRAVQGKRVALSYILLIVSLAVGVPGCSKKSSSSSAEHLTPAAAKAHFPKVLGSFARSGFKHHERDEKWVEYRSEYLRGTQTIKITIRAYGD